MLAGSYFLTNYCTNCSEQVRSKYTLSIVCWCYFQISFLFYRKKSLISLYYTLVYPYLSCCSIVWTSTYPTNSNCVYLLHKRVMRVISKSDYLAHSALLFSRLNVLYKCIYQVNSFHVGKFRYKYQKRLLPSVFLDFFSNS